MSNYTEQFKSPEWQKKRLKIMDRDDFSCRICGTKTETLNVHHIFYEPHKSVWDYDDGILITLCENCHNYQHENNNFTLIKSTARIISLLLIDIERNGRKYVKFCEYFVTAVDTDDEELLKAMIISVVSDLSYEDSHNLCKEIVGY